MDDETKSPTYEVGFGRPPVAARFRPGMSGNPRGRPPGKLNASTAILRALEEKVIINEGGRSRKVSKFEAALAQVANKAAAGDLRALNIATELMRFAEERVRQEDSTTTRLQDADKRVLQNLMQRIEAIAEGGNDADCSPERQTD